eukprot:2213664-Amphidinium_carterae.2
MWRISRPCCSRHSLSCLLRSFYAHLGVFSSVSNAADGSDLAVLSDSQHMTCTCTPHQLQCHLMCDLTVVRMWLRVLIE